MDFKQQKIMISSIFMSLDFGEKSYFVEQVDNAIFLYTTRGEKMEFLNDTCFWGFWE
jgi:hypothetical protein